MTTTAYQKVMTDITAGNTIVIDGGTGTELQRRGAGMEKEAWCALATESHPQTLCEIHQDYIRAGARVITANTFASSKEILEPVNLGHKFSALNKQSVELAIEAREKSHSSDSVLIAGSITHITPGNALGFTPKSDPGKFEDDCCEMAAIHKAAGCDLIMAEMMGDPDYAPCVVRAAKANDLPVWVGIATRPNAQGTLSACMQGHNPLQEVLAPIVAAGGDVMGIMHSKAEITLPALQLLKRHWAGPLLAYPDSVIYRTGDEKNINLDHVIGEQEFVKYCNTWIDNDVQVLGGCCGLTVSHIKALADSLNGKLSE